MKISRILFVFLVFSALTFSCKSEKKDEASDKIDEAVETVKDAGSEAADAVKEGADAVGDAAKEGADAISDAAKEGADAISDAAKEGAEEVAEGVEGAVKGVEEMAVGEGVLAESLADTPVIYPGCAKETADATRECSKEKFIAFLKDEFNKNLGKELGLDPGDYEITTMVHVDEAGKVSALNVKAPHYRLEGEIKRVLAALPQMTPATEGGQPVPVTFTLPVDFKMN